VHIPELSIGPENKFNGRTSANKGATGIRIPTVLKKPE
jgi:hypothetical protein